MRNKTVYFRQGLLLFSFMTFSLFTEAQQPGIQLRDTSWSVLLAEAKSARKLIFVDAYASWCGPCKLMKKNVFTLPEVGALYNRNFINAGIDMEKGEGPALSKRYDVRAYPTFLFINGDGEVVHRTVGECSADEFMQNALDALSPTGNLRYLRQHYARHRNDYDYVSRYARALKNAYLIDKADTIALNYLEGQPESSLPFSGNWNLLSNYVTDPTSGPFRYLVDHQADYVRLYARDVVEKKIYDTYLAWPQHYVAYAKDGKPQLDEQGFQAFLSQVQSSPYARKQEIAAKSKLTVYFGMRQWKKYAATVDRMLEDHIVPMDPEGADWLYADANKVKMFAEGKDVLSAAAGWARIIANDIKGITPDNKAMYLDLYAALLEKAGKKEKALTVRKQIDQQKLTRAKKNMSFQALQPPQPKK